MLGRKRMCLVFCALYTAHCVLHGLDNFHALLLARAISGVATSLLFSSFEAWMVAEHNKRFRGSSLAETFAVQTQGNAIVAVLAGLVAQVATFYGGYAAPMAIAIPFLAYSAKVILKWPENIGSNSSSFMEVASAVFKTTDLTVLQVGMIQCLFEGSMHVFVFLWTPCLQSGNTQSLPSGVVFALYMLCTMLGGRQSSPSSRWQPSLGFVFMLAAFALSLPSISDIIWLRLAAFCCFEWCVGCYFPQIALLRSKFLHEETRGSTMTLFRVPFNCIVVAVLLWGRSTKPELLLCMASLSLLMGVLAYSSLPQTRPASTPLTSSASNVRNCDKKAA